MISQIKMLSIDQQIWEEELEAFVPKNIFDMHAHIFKAEHCLHRDDLPKHPSWLKKVGFTMDLPFLREYHGIFLPDREIHYLLMGLPFMHGANFERMNVFVAEEASKDSLSVSSMVVHPQMQSTEVAAVVDKYGFVGFKPYRWYSITGDVVECTITDMLPETLIEIADEKHLLITLHLGKRAGIADSDNIRDIIHLTRRYPNVQWVLAHCARSFNPCFLEKAIEQIRDIPNIWYDISAVCESSVFGVLLRKGPLKRILYGSDNMPAGADRGKYIAFGYGWALLHENNHSFDLSHCDSQMTVVLYEQLRALHRAICDVGLDKNQVEDIFYNNAMQLLKMCRTKNEETYSRG